MPPLRVLMLRTAAVVGAAALILAAMLAFVGPRSALARFTLGAFLLTHGMHLNGGDLRVGNARITADELRIDDDYGRVLTVAHLAIDYDWRGLVGRSDRRYGLRAIAVDGPQLRVVVLPDGSTNLSSFLPSAGAQPSSPRGAPAAAPLAYQLDVRIRDGRLDVENPSAVGAPGRAFAITSIQARAALHNGIGTGTVSALYSAQGSTTHVRGVLLENDAVGFAQLQLRAPNVALAPPLDAFVSTPLFIAQRGIADAVVTMYDAGYGSSGPNWNISAVAQVRDGRIHVVPLDVPLRDIRGALTLSAGYLGFGALRGQAAGLPILARGSIRLMPSVRLAFSADTSGDLRVARRLFSFSRAQAMDGPFAAQVRIDGLLADVHVAGRITTGTQIRVAGAPLRAARALFYYQNDHMALPALSAQYDGGRIAGDGDVRIPAQGEEPQFQAVMTGSVPVAGVPFVTNLNRGGTVQLLAAVDGPPSAAQLAVFARTLGGNGARATIALGGSTNASLAGALALAWPRGDLALQAGYDRTDPSNPGLLFALSAIHAPLRVFRGAAGLPGLISPVALPDLSALIDGSIVAGASSGAQTAGKVLTASDLQTGADLHARNIALNGARIGDLAVRAHGSGDQVTLDALTVAGRAVAARASGRARIDPSTLAPAAIVQGIADVDLGAFAAANAPIRGQLRGAFAAALSASGWAATIASRGGDARIAGTQLRDATLDATATRNGPTRFTLLANALGGTIGAFGSTSDASVFGSGIDVGALAPPGTPLRAGAGVILAHVTQAAGAPNVSASVAIANGRMGDLPLAGSADIEYAGRVVHAIGDVDLAQTRVHLSGSARDVVLGGSLGDATIDVTASVREGDLATLLASYLPSSMPVTGIFEADASLHGSAVAPHVSGTFESPASTLRGVTLVDASSAFSYDAGAIGLDNGSIQLGSSRLAFSGSYGGQHAHVQASSPRIDLSDVNDFFAGRDVLDGIGPAALALDLAPGSTHASGALTLRDSSAEGIPVGTVSASLADARGADGVRIDASQHSQLGASTLSGYLLFHAHRNALPDLRTASYSAVATASHVDLGLIARLAGLEDIGVRGTLDAHGTLRGTFSQPAVDVAFSSHDAYVRKIALLQTRGSIQGDLTRVALHNGFVQATFGEASADAQIDRAGRLQGTARLTVDDLRGAAQLLAPQIDVRGSAQADVHLGGDVRHPVVSTALSARPGEIFGVAYDDVSAHATFSKNELSIGDTSARLARGQGTLALSGTLPVELAPFGLGPPQRPVAMRASATGVQLAAFDPLVKQFGTIAGTLDADAVLSGTARKPELQGNARVRRGAITTPYQTVPLRDISADVALSHDAIDLADLSGTVGKGSFKGNGRAYVVPAVGLRKTPGIAYYASLHANQLPLDVPDWVSGTVNGDLGLTQSGETPLFAGDMTLSNGTIPVAAIVRLATTLGDAAPPPTANVPGLPPLLPGHTIVYGGGVYPPGVHVLTPAALATPAPSLFDLPSLNLQLAAAAQNVRVRGGPVDLTTDGKLDVGGSVRDPLLTGEFASKRGTISAYGVTFRVYNGVLTFDPDQGVLPSLDATAVTLINGDRITLEVSGRIDNLNTAMSDSNGQTPEQILATIVGGSTVGALTSGTSGQSFGTSAQRLLGTELTQNILSPFSSALAQSLNVEEVFFEFNALGQIVLEVRKYVTPTIAVLYGQTTTEPLTQYWGGAYQLRNNGSLEFTTTTAPSGFVTYQARLRVTFQ
ncbi:MAG: translocation/assembly module TamB domain-containing protein [Candidatus Eremiobacteraeota bacterium]|nr:translocation/assembly module TamB domain-containing protein [Candidatus Eremiobacteraeota bacterium]